MLPVSFLGRLLAWLQELQQQNQRLLAVNRQLAAEAESSRADAEVSVRAEYQAAVERLSQELEGLRSSRKDTEELLAQVGGEGAAGLGVGVGSGSAARVWDGVKPHRTVGGL